MAIAVGDIHGCLEPLKRLVERLPEDRTLVFLGDYIDRGPDSAGVIRYLQHLARRRPCRFLKGNHEDLMEQALADPSAVELWLMNGGAATLRSYGVEVGPWRRSVERDTFLSRADREFLAGLELYVEDDDAVFVHAGVDPHIPDMARQDPHVLLWIRERFFRNAHRWQGKPIVFGHTPTLALGLEAGEIFQQGPAYGIDTGCVFGGPLTAMDMHTRRLYQEPAAE